jgi:hypothetical protein
MSSMFWLDETDLRLIALACIELHGAVVELAFAELLAQLFARALIALRAGQRELAFLRRLIRLWWRRQQQVQHTLLGVHLGLVFHLFQALFADHVDGNLDQVADHRFDVTADIADLGELRSFHLEERRIGELGETARNLGFTNARRPNHDDVLGHDVVGKIGRQLLAAGAITQCNGHGALGSLLSDDVLVELGNNLARRQLFERNILVFSSSRQIDSHMISMRDERPVQ